MSFKEIPIEGGILKINHVAESDTVYATWKSPDGNTETFWNQTTDPMWQLAAYEGQGVPVESRGRDTMTVDQWWTKFCDDVTSRMFAILAAIGVDPTTEEFTVQQWKAELESNIINSKWTNNKLV